MKFNLGVHSEAWFDQDLKFKFCVDACLVEIVKLMLGRDSKDEI